ncbi:hypothetical protein AQUCO_01000210v1 [Aquilegia coerulea]|uniref:F-box domain-containing protein n=1 Tax=Aquilegia coerulea TaxID=218851 RepID=A0A2G5E8S4_AQUCA|nr:hypothetical protein AQUCO_01000210v1 [Aquilegia coerulea]
MAPRGLLASKKKKIAMSSSNKLQAVGPDRISALPDSLIHNIFAFLDMNQVVQTSVLSKRWKSLWVSNPCVTIKYEDWTENRDYCGSDDFYSDDFKKYVDRVLLLRDGSNIDKFYLECGGQNDLIRQYGDWENETETDIFNTWIASVMKRNVQEVKLQDMEMAPSTLKSLAGQIKSLTLESIHFRGEEKELLLSNHAMENLIIKDCDFGYGSRLTINAPNLKNLTLDNDGEDSSNVDSGIRICAQNLMVLLIKGKMYKDCLFENLSSVETASIEVNVATKLLSNILKGLHNAKSLTLSADSFQGFPEVPNLLDSLVAFQNLGYFKLTKWDTTKYICAIAKLLEKFPNLETLVLVGTEYVYSDSEGRGGDWGAQLSSCMFLHLKSVEIQNLHECANFFKFFEFLLKNAVNLENIVMTETRTTEKKKLDKVGKKLQVAPKASSKLKLFLKERNGTVNEI